MNRIYKFILALLFITSFSNFAVAQCEIWDVQVEIQDCDDGVFFVTLDFNYANVGSEGFSVVGNGNDYGDFDYTGELIDIGPFEGDGVTEYEIVVIDNQSGDCQDWTSVGPVFCGAPGCEITGFILTPTECDGDETYDLTIDFSVTNPTDDHFDLIYDDEVIGFYALSELPITLENFEDNGEEIPLLGVCINDDPDCCALGEYESPCFSGGGTDCEISGFILTPTECDGDETYDLTIDFTVTNPTDDHFDLIYDDEVIGFYALSELPITLENFEDNGEEIPLLGVCINDDPDCCALGEYESPCFSGGGMDCEISSFNYEVGDCNPDGTFHLWINFEAQNAPNDFFELFYNDEFYGFYPLSELPLHIENFEAEDTPEQYIVVCINDTPDCCSALDIEVPSCGGGNDCEIWEVFAEAYECDDDGNFLVDIEFNSNNTGGEGFTIVANDFEFGPFEYGETFYTFGPLEGGVVYEILVLDNQFSDCGGHYVLGPVYCDDDCHIYDLHAEATECDDEGQFYVYLDFEFANIGNDGFKVVGNGNVYGFFGYDDLPIEIGPFEAPVDELEFLVTDVQNPDCGDFIEIDGVHCDGGGDCEIYDLEADITPCVDGTFYVVLDFEHLNTSEIAFSVNGNGFSYGFYSYADLPVSIGPLIGNGTTPYEFVVHDILFEDCGAGIEVGPVDCDITGDCQITNFVVDPSACNDDGTYDLWLNFSYQNVTNLYFDVIFNGEIIAYYPLAELPVIIPHFPSNDIGVQEITVCINDSPDCCATTEYEAPDCLGPNLVWPGDAEANNHSNHHDLLNIGLAFGAEGPERDVQGIEWTDLWAEQWSQEFATGINFAHADCNGDGVVDKEDVQAIHVNFDETHGDVEEQILIGGSETDPPFYVDLLAAAPIVDGQQFTASIMLGNEDFSVDNLYGVAFTMSFDAEMIDPASIELKFDPSWLGVEDVNLITFDRVMDDLGQVHVALVRTDQNNVSGHGHIAEIIGIIDNIAGKEEFRIEITDVRAITAAEVLVPFTRPTQIAGIVSSTNEPIQGVFEVYPNPARTEVKLQHPRGLSVKSVQVKNVNGQRFESKLSGGNTLNISHLPDGVFFLTIETEEGMFIEKLVKM